MTATATAEGRELLLKLGETCYSTHMMQAAGRGAVIVVGTLDQ